MTLIDELKSLNELRDQGKLTDQEYANAKAATLKAQEVGTEVVHKPSSLTRKIAVVVVLVLLAYAFVVWYQIGTRNTAMLIATVVHAPITVGDEIENLRAHSLKAVGFNLPYDGTLDVTLSVVHGNPVDVLLTTPGQLAGLGWPRNWQSAPAYREFSAIKTTTYRRSAQLPKGNYYLVMRDTSLGILSSSASDISIKAELKP